MKTFIQKHQGKFANISTMTAFLGFREDDGSWSVIIANPPTTTERSRANELRAMGIKAAYADSNIVVSPPHYNPHRRV
jgi:hypothetical protein